MGICGRVLTWIRSFLTDKRVVINMAGTRAQEFVFILFIADCYNKVSCEKDKIADDGKIWINMR